LTASVDRRHKAKLIIQSIEAVAEDDSVWPMGVETTAQYNR